MILLPHLITIDSIILTSFYTALFTVTIIERLLFLLKFFVIWEESMSYLDLYILGDSVNDGLVGLSAKHED